MSASNSSLENRVRLFRLLLFLLLVGSLLIVLQLAVSFRQQDVGKIAISRNEIQNDSQPVQQMETSNVYEEFNKTGKLHFFYANGMPRTGSTLQMYILRVLIREKIDPNYIYGYLIHSHINKKKLSGEAHAIISKRHGPCGRLPDGKIFIAHRNVSFQICSAVTMGFIENWTDRMQRWCVKQWQHYQTCRNHRNMVYDMSHQKLVNNITEIIENMASRLNISHVMNKYDYEKIEYELTHIHGDEKNFFHNQVADYSSNATCDPEYVVEHVIKASPQCYEYYKFVNQLLNDE